MASFIATALVSALLASAAPTNNNILEDRSYSNGSAGSNLVPGSPSYVPYVAANVVLLPPPVVSDATCTNIVIPVTVSSVNKVITAVKLPLTNRDVTSFVTGNFFFLFLQSIIDFNLNFFFLSLF